MLSHLKRSLLGSVMLQSQKHRYSLQDFAMALVKEALVLVGKFSLSFPHLLSPYCDQLTMLLIKL